MRYSLFFVFLTISILSVGCNRSNESIYTFDGSIVEASELTQFLLAQMDSLEIPGISIAIINEAEIVYHKNLGFAHKDRNEKLTNTSIFEAASLSKPVFAYLVMKLSERGAIEMSRPLFFYLPDSSMEVDRRYKSVNANMVLSHSTGFPNWRWFDTPPDSISVDRGDFFMISNPGTKFTYSGEGYDYLARVIAKNTLHDMSEMSDLFAEMVTIPLEIDHMYFTWDEFLYENKVYGHIDGKATNRNWGSGLPYQNSFQFSSAGALHTEAKSYGRFLIAMMNGEGLLPETYKEMLRPRTNITRLDSSRWNEGIRSWGLGFAIMPLGSDTLYRHGGTHTDFQAEAAFSKNSKFGYVFFVNTKKGSELNEKLEKFLGISY